MQNTEVVFVCDESGAKGYALQKEAYCGEVGVVAGFLIGQGAQFTELNNALSQLFSEFPVARATKFHITDLSEAEQHAIRNKTFAVVIGNGVRSLGMGSDLLIDI